MNYLNGCVCYKEVLLLNYNFDFKGLSVKPNLVLYLNVAIYYSVSVTSKKLQNVYKSCPKMIPLEKCKILTPFHTLPKNVGDLCKLNCCQTFWKVAQSPINHPIWSHCHLTTKSWSKRFLYLLTYIQTYSWLSPVVTVGAFPGFADFSFFVSWSVSTLPSLASVLRCFVTAVKIFLAVLTDERENWAEDEAAGASDSSCDDVGMSCASVDSAVDWGGTNSVGLVMDWFRLPSCSSICRIKPVQIELSSRSGGKNQHKH